YWIRNMCPPDILAEDFLSGLYAVFEKAHLGTPEVQGEAMQWPDRIRHPKGK
ncbi:hypothetical protein Tco_0715801, partial [Tanacetum coccineum]